MKQILKVSILRNSDKCRNICPEVENDLLQIFMTPQSLITIKYEFTV